MNRRYTPASFNSPPPKRSEEEENLIEEDHNERISKMSEKINTLKRVCLITYNLNYPILFDW